METAKSYLGTPYKWGGDDFSGVDCSGLINECLKACGQIASQMDFTSDGLWRRYVEFEVDDPELGDLIFWFDKKIAYHVAIAYIEGYCITADGGGSKTKDYQDAIDQNAFIKYRPISHRKSKPRFVRIPNGD